MSLRRERRSAAVVFQPTVKPGPRLPRRLPARATIGIYAPSGVVAGEALGRAVAHFEQRGHRVVLAQNVTRQWRYFAGSDEERLAGLHQLLGDASIDLLMAARGGYGWSRLLPHVDWQRVAASDQILVGFSDFTAFSLAALARTGTLTFAGPMAATDFGNGNVSPFMEAHFWPLVAGERHDLPAVACEHSYRSQTVEGPLWGGNLSLLSHLVGTPYFPTVDGGILFVEEIAEQPYAVERMLMQLLHAGVLARQRALILADFDDCTAPPDSPWYPYSMSEVVDTLRSLLQIPVLTGLPFGHIHHKATLPFGAPARLVIGGTGYQLGFAGYNAAPRPLEMTG